MTTARASSIRNPRKAFPACIRCARTSATQRTVGTATSTFRVLPPERFGSLTPVFIGVNSPRKRSEPARDAA